MLSRCLPNYKDSSPDFEHQKSQGGKIRYSAARFELRLLPYSVPFDPEDVPDPLGPLGAGTG